MKNRGSKRLPRIALLGGAFNPVHIGHLHIANVVLNKHEYDKIMFIPTYLPPHKSNYNLVSPSHRLSMLRLATRGCEEFIVSDIEIKREGFSYTADTVQSLRISGEFINPLGLIIGDDLIDDLHLWKDSKKLFDSVNLLIAHRRSCRVKFSLPHVYLDNHLINLSSSALRDRVSKNKEIKSLVPDGVGEYIKDKKLYKGNKNN